MNVDKAMEAAAAYLTFEQAGEPMFASEQVAVTLAKEVERLRGKVEFLKESRDAFMLLAGRMISDSSKLCSPND